MMGPEDHRTVVPAVIFRGATIFDQINEMSLPGIHTGPTRSILQSRPAERRMVFSGLGSGDHHLVDLSGLTRT